MDDSVMSASSNDTATKVKGKKAHKTKTLKSLQQQVCQLLVSAFDFVKVESLGTGFDLVYDFLQQIWHLARLVNLFYVFSFHSTATTTSTITTAAGPPRITPRVTQTPTRATLESRTDDTRSIRV